MPKYSLIIPFYNVKDYILECAKSIYKQKYDNFEAIFVNDGSKDETDSILEKYLNKINDKRFKKYTKKNGGVASARNYGLKHAKGDYVFFIDSDDFLDTNALLKINEEIEKTNPDILIMDFYEYFKKDNMRRCSGLYDLDTDDITKKCLLSPPAPWNKVIKRSLLIENNVLFPTDLWYEDLATTTKLYIYTNNIKHLDMPLYYYRQLPNSAVNKIDVKIMDMIDILSIIYDFYEDNSKLDYYYNEIEKTFIYNCYFAINKFSKSNIENKENYQKKIIEFLNNHFKNWKKNKYLKQERMATRILLYSMRGGIYLKIFNILKRSIL